MLMLQEAPADTVVPVRESGGYVGHESSSVRLSAIPDRLMDGVLALMHAITELAAVAGIVVVAALSAEMAHDLCMRVRSRPAREGGGRRQSTDRSSSLTLPVGAVQTADLADQQHWRYWS